MHPPKNCVTSAVLHGHLACLQVWACGAVLYQEGAGGESLGEAWGTPSGLVSLGGFALLVLGTILYAQVQGAASMFGAHDQRMCLVAKLRKLPASQQRAVLPHALLPSRCHASHRVSTSAANPVPWQIRFCSPLCTPTIRVGQQLQDGMLLCVCCLLTAAPSLMLHKQATLTSSKSRL